MHRRNFLTALTGMPLVGAVSFTKNNTPSAARYKISLNAYSFNALLMAKTISHRQLLEFCAQTGFDAIDMTGYYFSTYPQTPSDEEIYAFKRDAHALGLEISGTGIRNEFGHTDTHVLEKELDLVKRWIEVAAKLGAPVLRVYTAKKYAEGDERKKIRDTILRAMEQSLVHAAQHGVLLGIQNHNDFLRTAEECYDIITPLNSKWVGLVLDTGNFIAEDPYAEIKKAIPLAVNWQLKEKLLIGGQQTPMDLDRLINIIRSSAYKGTVPIETLGMTDPLRDVPVFFNNVRTLLNA